MDLTLFINNEHRADDDLPARFNDHIECPNVTAWAFPQIKSLGHWASLDTNKTIVLNNYRISC